MAPPIAPKKAVLITRQTGSATANQTDGNLASARILKDIPRDATNGVVLTPLNLQIGANKSANPAPTVKSSRTNSRVGMGGEDEPHQSDNSSLTSQSAHSLLQHPLRGAPRQNPTLQPLSNTNSNVASRNGSVHLNENDVFLVSGHGLGRTPSGRQLDSALNPPNTFVNKTDNVENIIDDVKFVDVCDDGLEQSNELPYELAVAAADEALVDATQISRAEAFLARQTEVMGSGGNNVSSNDLLSTLGIPTSKLSEEEKVVSRRRVAEEMARIEARASISPEERQKIFEYAIALDVPRTARKLIKEEAEILAANRPPLLVEPIKDVENPDVFDSTIDRRRHYGGSSSMLGGGFLTGDLAQALERVSFNSNVSGIANTESEDAEEAADKRFSKALEEVERSRQRLLLRAQEPAEKPPRSTGSAAQPPLTVQTSISRIDGTSENGEPLHHADSMLDLMRSPKQSPPPASVMGGDSFRARHGLSNLTISSADDNLTRSHDGEIGDNLTKGVADSEVVDFLNDLLGNDFDTLGSRGMRTSGSTGAGFDFPPNPSPVAQIPTDLPIQENVLSVASPSPIPARSRLNSNDEAPKVSYAEHHRYYAPDIDPVESLESAMHELHRVQRVIGNFQPQPSSEVIPLIRQDSTVESQSQPQMIPPSIQNSSFVASAPKGAPDASNGGQRLAKQRSVTKLLLTAPLQDWLPMALSNGDEINFRTPRDATIDISPSPSPNVSRPNSGRQPVTSATVSSNISRRTSRSIPHDVEIHARKTLTALGDHLVGTTSPATPSGVNLTFLSPHSARRNSEFTPRPLSSQRGIGTTKNLGVSQSLVSLTPSANNTPRNSNSSLVSRSLALDSLNAASTGTGVPNSSKTPRLQSSAANILGKSSRPSSGHLPSSLGKSTIDAMANSSMPHTATNPLYAADDPNDLNALYAAFNAGGAVGKLMTEMLR